MKRIHLLKVWMLGLVLLPLLSSCGGDDAGGDINSLGDYIIGNWHSYKATVYANGNSNTVNVDKTGEYSALYFEGVFEKGSTVIIKGWKNDSNGASHWEEEVCTYSVNGDIVKITDSNGESIDTTYSTKDRSLILRFVLTINGVQVTCNIFFKK